MKTSRILSTLIIFLLFVCSCTKEELSIQGRLRSAMDKVFSTYNGRGISVSLVLPNSTTLIYTIQKNGSAPIEKDMLFWIASITKTFTSAAIMQLVEEGTISLTDSLYLFLLAFPNIDSTITNSHLLNHTSGVFNITGNPLYDEMMEEDRSKIWSPEEILTRMVLQPYFSPGQGQHYSDTGYILLGMIIKEVTKNQLSEEFSVRFYQPLGLNHTFLDAEETITGEFVNFWAYFDEDGTDEEVPVLSVERYSETSTAWSAGGLFSTAQDIARWIWALFHGNVLEQQTISRMIEDGYGVLSYSSSLTGGARAYGHDGNAGLFYRMRYICLTTM